MGIQGLLPLLKSIQKPCNLKQFAGETIGVDGYGWLHRGTVTCSFELATGRPTTKYVEFAMSRVRMLKHFGINPYIILDGDYLPSKSKTEKERAARRREARDLGAQLMSLGKVSQAHLEFQKAVDVTPEMAGLFIAELKRAGVPYIVAPYEADSQMVYLEKKGIINGILSEDSDLLVFGARKLLTKLDQYGDCVMVRRDDFTACKEVSFVGWSDQEFRTMAILSGCDYLASIGGMGLKTAHRLLRKHKTVDRVLRAVQFDGKFKVPAGYLDAFTQAERTFLHQWIYCPNVQTLLHLTPLEDRLSLDDLPYIGGYVEPAIARGVVRGELHPHTKEPLELPALPPPKKWTPSSSRRPAVAATPDLKKHKSIEKFFKPQRTPLAEMDVNLFTGSPHQQAMARRASGSSWPATPVINTPPVALTRSTTMPSSTPVITNRLLSEKVPVRKSDSDRGVKRQRLCADRSSPMSERQADALQYGRSKFFDSSKTPSKRSKSERSKKAEFNVWSDESLEEAMKEIPLPDGSASRSAVQADLEDNDDGQSSVPTVAPSEKGGSSTAETQATNTSRDFSQDQNTQDTILSSPEVDLRAEHKINTFDESFKTEISAMCANYIYNAPKACGDPRGTMSTPGNARRRTSENERLQDRSRHGKPDLNHYLSLFTSSTASVDLRSNCQNPDQLCANIISSRDDGESKNVAENTGQPQRETDDPVVIPDSDPLEPHSPAKSQVHDVGQAGPSVVGSEDLLIPESEAEGSEQGTPKAAVVPRPFLDLGRFAFTSR